MKTISSADFRTQYHKLTEPHEVVVLGRVIGIWTPVEVSAPEIPALAKWTPEFNPVPKPLSKKRR